MSDDDDFPGSEPFTIPLPPPPPGMTRPDVLYFRGAGAAPVGDSGTPRDNEDIMLRRVPAATAMKFRAAAGGRGMTHGQYLAALVSLHEAIRAAADTGDASLKQTLEDLGLQTVSV
jgi:hypothetical protein